MYVTHPIYPNHMMLYETFPYHSLTMIANKVAIHWNISIIEFVNDEQIKHFTSMNHKIIRILELSSKIFSQFQERY